MAEDRVGNDAMELNWDFILRTSDEEIEPEALGQQPAVDRDAMADVARKEVERFINGHIDDSTQGWPVLSRKVGPGRRKSA
jgi:hypothetical protein